MDIHLKGPICKCEKQNLGWGIRTDGNANIFLYIFCNTCKIYLEIPHNKLTAAIMLKTGYPKGIEEKPNNELNKEITEADRDFLKKLNIKID